MYSSGFAIVTIAPLSSSIRDVRSVHVFLFSDPSVTNKPIEHQPWNAYILLDQIVYNNYS